MVGLVFFRKALIPLWRAHSEQFNAIIISFLLSVASGLDIISDWAFSTTRVNVHVAYILTR